MLKYLPLTWKNVFRNRRRSLLTVLSVTASLFLLGILLSVYATFYHREPYAEKARRLVTRHKVSLVVSMPEYYGDRIRKIDGVEEVGIFNWFQGTYIDNRPEHFFARFAAEPEKVFRIRPELQVPPEQLQAFLRDRQAIAVGKSVADRVGVGLGQRITIKGDIYPVDLEFVIRAIFAGPDDNESYFHWKYLQESLPQPQRGQVGTFIIRARSTEDVPRIAQTVDEMFRNSPQPTKTESESAFELFFVNQLGNIKLLFLSIASAVLFTILLISANTVAMSVRERIAEVGVLRTVGFTARAVRWLIVSESVLIALAGGLLGTLLCYLFTLVMADVMVVFFQGFLMPWWAAPVCLSAALLIGLLSSVVPASVAARTTIVDALRHTG